MIAVLLRNEAAISMQRIPVLLLRTSATSQKEHAVSFHGGRPTNTCHVLEESRADPLLSCFIACLGQPQLLLLLLLTPSCYAVSPSFLLLKYSLRGFPGLFTVIS